MSRSLITLPSDTIRDVFDVLDDASLFTLLQVCRAARIIGLVTFFTRYKILGDGPTQVSFSSGHFQDLQDNLMRITKLIVRHDDVFHLTMLTPICWALPNIVELELDIASLTSIYRNGALLKRLVHLICALLERRDGISNLLVLDSGYCKMSKRRRRKVGTLRTRYIPEAVLFFTWPITLPIVFLSAATQGLRTFLLDPFALRKQRSRLRKDMRDILIAHLQAYDSYRSPTLRLKLKPLPPTIFPSRIRENWNLIVFDGAEITKLQIGHGGVPKPSARKNCGRALSAVHLPALQLLSICKKASLSMADITSFLVHHPTIEYLSLNHCSIVIPRPVPGVQWPMPSLTALEAPLHYLEAILRDIDIHCLSEVCIGRRPGRQGHVIETKFDFNVLNRVLDVLTRSGVTSLMIVLPGGLKSQQWLDGIPGSSHVERAEKRMLLVETVTLYTERDKPFHKDIAPSLQNWLRLFSSAILFQCTVPVGWSSLLGTEDMSNVTLRLAYNGGRGRFIRGVPWGNCRSCED